MDKMQETNTAVTAKKVRIITSKNSPELAAKMKKISAYLLEKNDQLYKDLEKK